METKQFQNLLESIINLNEDHMKGKTVIVNGKRGLVGKEVSSDGQTENDEVYRVKFEDGSTKDIPARDMEIAGDAKNKKQPSENEAEDIVNEIWGTVAKAGVALARPAVKLAGKVARPAAATAGRVVKKVATSNTGKAIAKDAAISAAPAVAAKGATALRNKLRGRTASQTSESVELDELSNKTLAHYLVKASKSLDDGSAKHKGKRAKGMMKALKKRPFANISKKESVELDELKKSTLGSYINKAASGIKKSEYEAGRAGRRYDDAHSRMSSSKPEVRKLGLQAKGQALQDYRAAERTTKKRQSGIQRAVKKLGEGSLGYQKALRSKGKEKEGVRSGNKREKAMDFRRWDAERQKNKKAHGTNEDYQCPKEVQKQNLKGVGVGIPAINNKKWGTGGLTNGGSDTAIGSPVGNPDVAKKAKKAIKEDMSKYDSYTDWAKAGFPTKQKKKKPMVKVKTNREIGWEMRDGATGKVIKKGGPPVSKK